MISFFQPGPILPGIAISVDNENETVTLKWLHADKSISAYTVQRSADENAWIEFKPITATGASLNELFFSKDDHPGAGKNYYRLKVFFADKHIEYTPSHMTIMGRRGGNWAIYPIPVKDMLNLQYNGTESIKGVIGITIQNVSNGQFYQRLRVASTSRLVVIPVNNLGRGIYLVRITVGGEVKWSQKFSK